MLVYNILGTNRRDFILYWRLRADNNDLIVRKRCIINERMKPLSNTVLGILTEWDKVIATVAEFTGHLWALCLAILQDRHILFARADR